MTSLLMKSTSADKDTLHEQDQPLKKLAYVSNHRGPLLKPVRLKRLTGLERWSLRYLDQSLVDEVDERYLQNAPLSSNIIYHL